MRLPFQNNHAWRYTKLKHPNTYIPKSKIKSKRFWFMFLLIFGFIAFITTVNLRRFKFLFISNVGHTDGTQLYRSRENKSAYLINTSGCRISYLDPHDPEVYRLYFRDDISMACDSKYLPRLFGSNDSAIFILPERKPLYVDDKTKINCCWSSIIRVPNNDSKITINETCNSVANSANIDVEFIQVSCSKKTNPWYMLGYERTVEIYKDYFYFVPRKPEVEKRCLKARENSKSEDPPLSVLIVGLDSVSRVNLHRQMPKTLQALRDLESIEMLGYNKIGYNTFPNVMAALSGQSKAEIDKGCWKARNQTFDDCDLIWKNFSSAGYRTIFGEDACEMATFNYLKKGFQKPPTDYYLRPYCLAIENNIGNTWRSYSNMCVGSILNYENLLNYTRKIATTFPDDPYFAFFWEASLTHDFVDYPRFGDDAYGGFLQYLKTDNLLRNTVLVFMSDHGVRFDTFRQTYQGMLEESLPFMFLAFPDWWKSKHPEAMKNFRENAHKLTTPFDLHETLRDILNPSTIDTSRKTISRGISWFSQVPETRTCEDAEIPETYCTCHKADKVSLSDKNVGEKIDALVDEVNGMVEKFPHCAKLNLKRVIDISYWHADPGDSNKVWYDYTITFETVPGNAIFEGTVRYAEGEKLTVLGSVSRLNAYGKSSACVDDSKIRLYCYCV